MMKRLIPALGLLMLAACSQPAADQAQQTATAAPARVTDSASADQPLPCEVLLAQARKLDSLLLNGKTLDKPMAELSVATFENYARHCKNDSIAPVYLIKGAQVAQSVMNFQKSKSLLQTCLDSFPNFRNRPAAMFMLAQLYDEHTMLNNEAEAKKIYDDIIYKYPKTAWAENAHYALNNLGKSDADLVKEFSKKNKGH